MWISRGDNGGSMLIIWGSIAFLLYVCYNKEDRTEKEGAHGLISISTGRRVGAPHAGRDPEYGKFEYPRPHGMRAVLLFAGRGLLYRRGQSLPVDPRHHPADAKR